MLVFRTSALANLHDISPEPEHQPLRPLKSIPNPNNIEVKEPRRPSRCKLPPATNINIYKKRLKNNPNDSLSSSEHSISSAGEGETDENEQHGSFGKRNTLSLGSSTSGVDEANGEEAESGHGDADADGYAETHISDMPAAVLKLTYKFANTETKLLRRILSSHGLKEANENQHFNLLWTGLHMKPDVLRSLTPYQRINHFPR